jgi:hypothetical protein
MTTENSSAEISPETMLQRAHACLENAEMQQALAERQHFFARKLTISADDLDALGRELEASAIEMKGRELFEAARNECHDPAQGSTPSVEASPL